jgi:hypothetical protein
MQLGVEGNADPEGYLRLASLPQTFPCVGIMPTHQMITNQDNREMLDKARSTAKAPLQLENASPRLAIDTTA